jgi:broad specificity phosphatase PhoE
MSLPKSLFLIRHGESIGNVALNAAKQGNLDYFTDSFINTPDTEWKLSVTGRKQSAAIGAWLTQNIEEVDKSANTNGRFYYVSPLRRTRETAGFMDVQENGESPGWRLNRSIRERDYGDIGSIPRAQFLIDPIYANSAKQFDRNPLYWRPPGGESIVDVAENRVRNFFDTLHRLDDDSSVVAVTHGEFIKPELIDGTWNVINPGEWKEIYFHTYSNTDLIGRHPG